MSTIVAVATGTALDAGVGIVRISGEKATAIAGALFRVHGAEVSLAPNHMTLGKICGGGIEEQAFCVYFKAPLSYTGEDVVELHCHGGKAILKTVVSLCVDCGAEPAARGEFTRRAFLNGKITLDKAEGVLQMIEAESSAELLQASRLMNGELRREIDRFEELLLKATANLEVCLDYPEEIEDDMRAETRSILEQAATGLAEVCHRARLGRLVKDGAKIALVGAPNAGKSSLLNILLKEDRAIVTDVAGTTRDTLEGQTELHSVKVTFVDTAGLRESDNVVEQLGVARAMRAEQQADLTLYVVDMTCPDQKIKIPNPEKTIIVGNKCDVAKLDGMDIAVSAKQGIGIEDLKELIATRLDLGSIEHASVITNERHRNAVLCALRATESALAGYETNSIDCILVDIKAAHRALCEVSGKDVSESIVDKIFASFCVGK